MWAYSRLKQYYRYRRNLKKLEAPKHREVRVEELELYSQFLNKGDLCFDVGANIGDKTELFLRLGATVVAVEPQESCWRVLKKRFKSSANVHIETCVLSNKAGEKTLFVDKSTTLSSTSQKWISAVKRSGRFSAHRWAYRVRVPASTLDELIGKYGRPAFCKIDVEGAELEVIEGLSVPIKSLCFEFIPEYLEPVLGCIEHLSKLGKAEFNYCLDGWTFALPDWVAADDMTGILQDLPGKSTAQGDIYVRFT